MPLLSNPRHERFAQELARGRSSTEAYKEAGYDCEGSSAWSAASRLSRNVQVSARVRELQTAGAERAVLTEEWVISRLMANAERAMQAEAVTDHQGEATGEFKYDGAVANRALELLGKRLGIFVDRSDVTQTVVTITDEPLSPEEWAAQHVTEH
jgi:phage terminase small subunit